MKEFITLFLENEAKLSKINEKFMQELAKEKEEKKKNLAISMQKDMDWHEARDSVLHSPFYNENQFAIENQKTY